MEASFIQDALLHDFPLKLDLVVSILMELRRSFRLGSSPVQPQPAIVEGGTELHLIDLIKVARQLFKCGLTESNLDSRLLRVSQALVALFNSVRWQPPLPPKPLASDQPLLPPHLSEGARS
jgi:hypothetical protein